MEASNVGFAGSKLFSFMMHALGRGGGGGGAEPIGGGGGA